MKHPLSLATVALGLVGISGHAWAVHTQATGNGLTEIGDAELAQMRGRWTPPGNTSSVAYFGVTMTSDWNATSGQQLSSSMSLGMNFDTSGNVQVTFQPTVTIVQTTPTATTGNNADSVQRTVDSSGLNNVSGLVQGVQIAGDSNLADNVTSVAVTTEGDAGSPTPATGTAFTGQSQTYAMNNGDASASASIGDQGMQVSLSITGQGQVQQWINGGSLGQVIAIGADGQSVHNSLQLQLVQRSLAGTVDLSRDLAQSMTLMRGIGMSY
jgi:hypothetical protein